MEKLKRIETEVEQFLPNYFLPEEELLAVTEASILPLLLGLVCAGVCGLSFFLWITMFSGNNVVAAGDVKNNEETITAMHLVSDSLKPMAQAARLSGFARKKQFSLEFPHVTHSNN